MKIEKHWFLLLIFVAFVLARIFLFGEKEIPLTQRERIISFAPNVTEMLFALGVQERVVGVTRFCKSPPQAQEKEIVGDLFNPSLERIVSLKPTKFISLEIRNPELKKVLRLSKAKIVEIPNETIEEIFIGLRIVGDALEVKSKSDSIETALRESLKSIATENKLEDSLKIGIVIGRSDGSLEEIYVAGEETFYTELLKMLGAKNAFGDLEGRYPTVSLETLLETDPDILIEIQSELNEAKKQQILEIWQELPHLSAVKNGKLKFLSGKSVAIPGIKIDETFENLAKIIKE
ncbi:MAG: hypothetical protein DWQ06_14165 [Calditrichaeota bacterium]|nr:MAG: hypothetical protein DWQ06_14165 [Calditrichota bacterium]